MSDRRLTNLLMGLIAILLLATLVRPLFEPTAAFAQMDKPQPETVALTGTGTTAWVLKGGAVYYLKFETQYESIRIYGPEALEH